MSNPRKKSIIFSGNPSFSVEIHGSYPRNPSFSVEIHDFYPINSSFAVQIHHLYPQKQHFQWRFIVFSTNGTTKSIVFGTKFIRFDVECLFKWPNLLALFSIEQAAISIEIRKVAPRARQDGSTKRCPFAAPNSIIFNAKITKFHHF